MGNYTLLLQIPLAADGSLSRNCSAWKSQMTLKPVSELYPEYTVSDSNVRIGMIDLVFALDGSANTPPSLSFSDETGTMKESYASSLLVYATGAVHISGGLEYGILSMDMNLRKGWNISVWRPKPDKSGDRVTANDLPSDGC